jgi:hypothetical protein
LEEKIKRSKNSDISAHHLERLRQAILDIGDDHSVAKMYLQFGKTKNAFEVVKIPSALKFLPDNDEPCKLRRDYDKEKFGYYLALSTLSRKLSWIDHALRHEKFRDSYISEARRLIGDVTTLSLDCLDTFAVPQSFRKHRAVRKAEILLLQARMIMAVQDVQGPVTTDADRAETLNSVKKLIDLARDQVKAFGEAERQTRAKLDYLASLQIQSAELVLDELTAFGKHLNELAKRTSE